MEKILVETSARHIHLTDDQVELLFGKGHKLTFKKALSQPGQFASEERVTLVGPKRTLERVSILGPTRSAAQVELAFTDARSLGVQPPVRESGDLAGSAGDVKVIGPAGELDLKEGVIVAKRHIHMTQADADHYGVKNGQIVSVKITGTGREVVFGDVVIRVSEKYSLAMHIDTDESNAACAFGECYGELIK